MNTRPAPVLVSLGAAAIRRTAVLSADLPRLRTISRAARSRETISSGTGTSRAVWSTAGCTVRALACLTLVAGALAPRALAQGSSSFVNFESPQVHPIDVAPSGERLAAVNTADNCVELFDIVGGTPVRRGSVFTGLEPVSVRFRGNDEVWVVNQLSDSVSLIDPVSMRTTRVVRVGDEPADIVFAGSPVRACVSLAQPRQLARFDPTVAVPSVTTIDIAGPQPRALATSPDGATVYIAVFESGNRSVIVPRATVNNASGPYGGQNPPPNSGAQFSPPRTPGQPTPPRVAHIVRKNAAGEWRDGNNRNWTSLVTWDVLDNDLAIVNANTGATSYVKGLMTTLAGLGVAPDGRVVAVGTEASNEVRFEANLNGVFLRCLSARVGALGAGSPLVVDLNPHLSYTSPSTDPVTRSQSIGDPRGVAWMPDGSRYYVAGLGSNTIAACSAGGARLAHFAAGEGPTGLVVSPDGSRLYVLNRFEATVSAFSTASNSEVARVAFHDPTPAVVRAGRPLLYDTHATSGLGHVSCASCHIDARSDRIAWDLGDPAGSMISFTGTCVEVNACINWHPMKGPMVTQTLQGIIGQEPLHWRGEKPGIEDFNVAYTHLQGRASEISASEMAALKEYLRSVRFGPQPNRNIDNTLRTSLAIFGGVATGTGGTGNPQNGQVLFDTLLVLPNAPGGNTRCIDCHPGSVGTGNEIGIPLGPVQQNRKVPHLREVYRKTGANLLSTTALRGFGFNADSEFQTLQDLLQVGFVWGTGTTATTRRRDMEAFMLSFGTDTHAGVGQQAFASAGGSGADDTARIAQFVTIASAAGSGSSFAGLVVKGRVGGERRGWTFEQGSFRSDRAWEPLLSPSALLALSAPGSELVYTLVPRGTERRIGIDRDLDSFLDHDEIDAGSDPADPQSVPSVCSAASVSTYCTGKVNSLGCVPAVGTNGAQPSKSAGTFAVTCTNVLNQKSGLLFFGRAQLATPFQGGTLCVASPSQRTPNTNSGGNSSGDSCTGNYSYMFSTAQMDIFGMDPGETFFAQWWMRDPQSASTTGLSNAVRFTVCQ